MRTPRVSVVIPCFNHGEVVVSITSFKRDDVELIVADDRSTDERTRKEIDVLSAQGIKVIRQENRGVGAARNARVLASKGEYILPLSSFRRVEASDHRNG